MPCLGNVSGAQQKLLNAVRKTQYRVD